MGQYWHLVSIDSEHYSSQGKLGESLFGSFRYLEGYLYNPNTLPLSSTQLRTWILLSTPMLSPRATMLTMPPLLLRTVDTHLKDDVRAAIVHNPFKNEYLRSALGHASDSYVLDSDPTSMLVPNEVLPQVLAEIPQDDIEQVEFGPTIEYKPPKVAASRKVELLSLPNEVIREIFLSIPQTLDAVAFGLATERLWKVGEPRIIRMIHRDLAPWTGSRLICLGDYVAADDHPPNLMADKTLMARLEDCTMEQKGNKVATLYDLSFTFSESHDLQGVRDRIPRLFTRLPERRRSYFSDSKLVPSAIWRLCSEFSKWIDPCFANDIRNNQDEQDERVLRNLSKMAYVRDSGTPVSLGATLITQICWSSDPSTSIPYEGELHRGPWAGDRFDICPLRKHTTQVNKEAGWQDVTGEVADTVSKIWESEYGKDWRRHVR